MGRDRRRRQPGKPRVPVEQGLFLTIGVPEGPAGQKQIKRAAELLQRQGFRVGVTSPEAILAAAELIHEDQKKLREQAADGDESHQLQPLPDIQPDQGETDDGGDPELA